MDSFVDWGVVAIPAILGLVAWLIPVATSTRMHRFFLFIGCVLLSGLIWFQQHRARESRQAEIDNFTKHLTQIEQNTKTLPKRSLIVMQHQFLKDRTPPFSSKNPFIINIRFFNVDTTPARITGVSAKAYRFDHLLSQEEEDRLFATLRSDTKTEWGNHSLGPTQGIFLTLEPQPALTDAESYQLLKGQLFAYVMALVRYSDSSGNHETDFCKIFWGREPVMHNCRGNDGPRS